MHLRNLILILCFALSNIAKAQIYPVQITVQAIAPYPIYLNDFTQGMTDRLRVQLLLTDINVQSRRVRLKMSMTGGGINITNPEVVSGALPILLSGGIPEYLGNADLAPYFNPQNLPGLNPVAYTQPLPEGVYNLCFEAFDFITGEVLSRKSCYTMALIQNDPPFLSLPRNKEGVPQQDPQSLLFQWTPRHINATNVSYEFSLLELLDTFINPQAAMQVMQPYYQTTTYSTSLWLGPADAPLTPGRKYAWRVRAKSLSGMDELGTFKNNGYSETWGFTYTDANCNAPLGLLVTDVAKRSLKVQWMPIPPPLGGGEGEVTYRISYRPRGGSDRWYDRQTTGTELSIFDLDPATEYEFRVARLCAGSGFVFGNSIYASTASTTDSTVTASCGLPPAQVDVSNQSPLATLQPGETFTAGDFTVTALQVTGGGGNYSGDGFIVVPYLANAKVRVKFAGIFINSERKLAQGFVETTYDPTMSGVLDVDQFTEGGAGTGGVKTGTVATDYHTDFPIAGVEDIQVTGPDDNPTITISNPNNGGGSGLVIHPDSLPSSISDSKGDIYTVEPGANGGSPVITKAGEHVPMQTSPAQLNNLASDKGKVLFAKNNNTQYAFDAYRPEYGASVLWQKEYQSLSPSTGGGQGEVYRVAAKATLPGKPDRITAQITITDNTLQADKVQFVTPKGIKYNSKHLTGNDYEVMLVGSPADDAQELYAVYPLPINSPADSGKYISLGKLLVAGYAPQTAKVVVVPVNGGSVNKTDIETELNKTYNGVGVKWEVQVAEPWNNNSWDLDHDGKLSVTGSSAWSVYTPEMKALNEAYKASHSLVSGAAYLFALPQAAPTEDGKVVYGDMPRGKRYGYLFNGSNGRTAAHEMGHGMFSLKHTFDNAYGFGMNAMGDNLMSYGDGINLSKLQWDAIHAPGLAIGVFEGDEDAAYKRFELVYNLTIDDLKPFDAIAGKVPFVTPTGEYVFLDKDDYYDLSFTTDGSLLGFTKDGLTANDDRYFAHVSANNEQEFKGYAESKNSSIFQFDDVQAPPAFVYLVKKGTTECDMILEKVTLSQYNEYNYAAKQFTDVTKLVSANLGSTTVYSKARCKLQYLDKEIAEAGDNPNYCLRVSAHLRRYFDPKEVEDFSIVRKKQLLKFFSRLNCPLKDNAFEELKNEQYFVAALANIPENEQGSFLDYLVSENILHYLLDEVDTRWLVTGGEDNFTKAIAYLSKYSKSKWSDGFNENAVAINFATTSNQFKKDAMTFNLQPNNKFKYDVGNSVILLQLLDNEPRYFGPFDPIIVNFTQPYVFQGVKFEGKKVLPAIFFYGIANEYVNRSNLAGASLVVDVASLFSGGILLKQLVQQSGKAVLRSPKFWRAVTGTILSAGNIAANTVLADKLQGTEFLEYWNTINLLYGVTDIGINLYQFQQARGAAKIKIQSESAEINSNFDEVADELEVKLGNSIANAGKTYKNVQYDDFIKTFTATDEQYKKAYQLWGEDKWDELHKYFKDNNLNNWNGVNWPPFNGAKSILKTEKGNQLAGKVFDRFQTGPYANQLGGGFASPVLNSSEGVNDLVFTYDSRALADKIQEGTYYYKFQMKENLPADLEFEYGEAIPWFNLLGNADQIKTSIKFQELFDKGYIQILEVLKRENNIWIKVK